MKVVKGIGQFWYDFIIGDDWKLAAVVAAVLLAGYGFVSTGHYHSGWLPIGLSVALALGFTGAVIIDTRGKG
jgi:hypothetical protein